MANTAARAQAKSRSYALGRRRREQVGNVVAWIILAAGSVIMMLPFIWMVSTSLKDISEVYSYPPTFIPETVKWSNYLETWRRLPFQRFFLNSLIVSGTVTLGQLFTCSLAGYSFARLRYPGRDTLFLLYLATMMIPFAVVMIPLYALMRYVRWADTLYALIVPAMFSAWGTFLMRQFMVTLPKELEDAARIDGCSFFRLYWTIILPLCKPALTTLGIFAFMGSWNDFMWPLIIINTISNKTLPLGLVMFQARTSMKTPWELIMAAATFSILPILIVFAVGQKYYVQGIVTSGLKGSA